MKLLLVAGEASGDEHGAKLASALSAARPDLQLFGAGGPAMSAAGATPIFQLVDLAVVGLWDVLKQLAAYRAAMRLITKFLDTERPDTIILIDFPGFNLRLAKIAHDRGLRVIYYISPQLWAWRPGRIHHIKRCVDHMLVILPFEERLYRDAGVPVTFVGHPLLDRLPPDQPADAVKASLGIPERQPLISLLPGSRTQEIAAHWPTLCTAASLISAQAAVPPHFAVLRATDAPDAWNWPHTLPPLHVVGEERARRNCLAASDLALVCSGTATLETATLLRPLLIFYKTSLFNWAVFRPLVRIPSIGLVNVVAGDTVVPEFVQFGFTPQRLAQASLRLLNDPQARRAMEQALSSVKHRLGEPGTARRAADAVLRTVCPHDVRPVV